MESANCLDSNKIEYIAEAVEIAPGLRRFVHRWNFADSNPKATVCIVHGLGEHGGRYGELAGDLVRRGYKVLALDQQGHGRDSGARGVITQYEDLLREAGFLLSYARQTLPKSPGFLLGHSMGGNIVVNLLLRHGQSIANEPLPTAAVLSSPFFRTQREPKGLMNVIARGAARILPNFCVGTGISSEWLTDDIQQQELVNGDALYHRRVSLKLGAALIDSGRWAIEHASHLPVPTLIIHGSEDCLTLPEASVEFAKRAGSLCRMELLSNHRHESFRDVERKPVIGLVGDFFDSYLKGNAEVKPGMSTHDH